MPAPTPEKHPILGATHTRLGHMAKKPTTSGTMVQEDLRCFVVVVVLTATIQVQSIPRSLGPSFYWSTFFWNSGRESF